MSPWAILFAAGVLEVVWATAMKASNGFTHVGYATLTAVTAFISFWMLGVAMRDLPLGTAYAVWVGIGAAGAAILGIVWFSDALTVTRVAGIGMILGGVALLKWSV